MTGLELILSLVTVLLFLFLLILLPAYQRNKDELTKWEEKFNWKRDELEKAKKVIRQFKKNKKKVLQCCGPSINSEEFGRSVFTIWAQQAKNYGNTPINWEEADEATREAAIRMGNTIEWLVRLRIAAFLGSPINES